MLSIAVNSASVLVLLVAIVAGCRKDAAEQTPSATHVAEVRSPPPAESGIGNYRATFVSCRGNPSTSAIAIRTYTVGAAVYFVTVDPNTFETQTGPAERLCPLNVPTDSSRSTTDRIMVDLQHTPYMRALARYTSPPYLQENYGVQKAECPKTGVLLTVDMCPSRKPYEEGLFDTLASLAVSSHQATPVAISVSGLWITRHEREFLSLLKQQSENRLRITWINHSFSHRYSRDVPDEKNFLLSPGTNVLDEILSVEQLLLKYSQVPSVFFRFPGLISSESLVLQLRQLGLIPIGSNAWLAKGEDATAGSIVLIHGNANEHRGVELFNDMLQRPGAPSLLALSEAFSGCGPH